MICFASYPFWRKQVFWNEPDMWCISPWQKQAACAWDWNRPISLMQENNQKHLGMLQPFFLPSFQIHIYDRKQPCDFWLLRPKECREQIWLVLPSDSHATANASGASPRVPGKLRLQRRITHVKTTNWSYLSLVVIAINPTVVFENGACSPIYGYINGEAHEPDHETSPHEWI